MSWLTIIRLVVVWYAMVQLVALAVLPLTLRVMRALPDRGYSLTKIMGILLVGVVYWLGFSYGLLRNERGGVWVALVAVAAASWLVGWGDAVAWWRSLRQGEKLRALLATEIVFVVAFVGWSVVRAYDPNVDHTEQPMDLMFMDSIWASPTFPPQDAWLAGYGISYYYLGYWLLTTLGRLTSTTPNVAYNLAQAVWYGYLWVGCFGVVMNLLAWRLGRQEVANVGTPLYTRIPALSVVGGFLGGVTVAFVGNLQVILEWLYAQGVNVDGLARWVNVHDFPQNAVKSGLWFIDTGWWWWRSSRVIQDVDLSGNYRDVIDEFPIFSYLLGDNHPHVMAMPFVVLVIALAFNLLLLLAERGAVGSEPNGPQWRRWLPLTGVDIAVYLVALGSLVFLNTWDYPPYWLLLVAVVFLASGGGWRRAIVTGGFLFVAGVLLYLPYFLTAQSQAGGLIPNVLNPTHLPQFLMMFGGALPALIGLLILGWRLTRPNLPMLGWVALVVSGLPIGFLALCAALSSTAWAQGTLASAPTPDGVTYASVIAQRWLSEPWTLLFVGVLLTVIVTCLVAIVQKPLGGWAGEADLVFVLLLGAIGLALVYAPEFIFLKDNFGSRMNTVFKFYYQGWLLFGLASAYLITVAVSHIPRGVGVVTVLAFVSLLLVIGSAIFPVAGVYSKTNGFARPLPTLDATAYVAQALPDVMAAAEWVRLNTTPDEWVLEGKGGSYAVNQNRISAMTGRATLLGWDQHEAQWRGEAYGRMAQGRAEAIEKVYRTGSPDEIAAVLAEWSIDYVFVGPAEIENYGITSFRLDEMGAGMDTVFSRGQVRIFRRREG
jgi:YYY domain-containing protein